MTRLSVPVSSEDHSQGPDDAPVVLLEYGDFECPHCGKAHWAVKQLQNALGDDLRYVYRHLPLVDIHPFAMGAARAAEAAGLQGRFWEMHDLLFEYQSNLDGPTLISCAAELGLDLDRFLQDIDGRRLRKRVETDIDSASRDGIDETPTFFVNGVRYDGDLSSEALLELLSKRLDESHRDDLQQTG